MTLERLTERLQEESERVGKIDGRRFNSRSRKKMGWEMRNIEKSIVLNERRKKNGARRSTYTKEELQEYKDIENKFRADMVSSRGQQEESSSEPSSPVSTPPPVSKKTSLSPTDSSELHRLK